MLKSKVFTAMDEAAPPETILASSASGITMDVIQSGCKHPERCVIGHPFNPSNVIRLVEVAGGAKTSEAVIERTMMFYGSIGKKPIRLRKVLPGHIGNRLQAALYRGALSDPARCPQCRGCRYCRLLRTRTAMGRDGPQPAVARGGRAWRNSTFRKDFHGWFHGTDEET
jgi:hypothetical protein